jgi:2,5-furandicarboxylate decarboxylase 1
VRVKAISHRRNPIYYALHMPWEVTWLMIPTRWSQLRGAMRAAGVQVKDMNVTLGGAGSWHVVSRSKNRPGKARTR